MIVTKKSLQIEIIIAFIYLYKSVNTINYCCSYNENECGWSDVSSTNWTSTLTTAPNLTDITNFQINKTPSEWLQNVYLTSTQVALKVSPTLKVDVNASISVDFYRHTPSSTADDVLLLLIQKTTGETEVLFSGLNEGWSSIEMECSFGRCCDEFPCYVQFQIQGTIEKSDELLAFDNFHLNKCL